MDENRKFMFSRLAGLFGRKGDKYVPMRVKVFYHKLNIDDLCRKSTAMRRGEKVWTEFGYFLLPCLHY